MHGQNFWRAVDSHARTACLVSCRGAYKSRTVRFARGLPFIPPMKLSGLCLVAAVVYAPLRSASPPQAPDTSGPSGAAVNNAEYDYDAIDRFLASGYLTHARPVSSKNLLRLAAHCDTNDAPGLFSAELAHGAEGYDRTACTLAMRALTLLTLIAILLNAPLNALLAYGSP